MVPVVKISPANAGDVTDEGSIPGSGRSSGGGNGDPLQWVVPGQGLPQSLIGIGRLWLCLSLYFTHVPQCSLQHYLQ